MAHDSLLRPTDSGARCSGGMSAKKASVSFQGGEVMRSPRGDGMGPVIGRRSRCRPARRPSCTYAAATKALFGMSSAWATVHKFVDTTIRTS